MSIKEYQQDGKTFFKVYRQVLGKINTRLRLQRSMYKIETYPQALREEKRLIKTLTEELGRLEGRGLFWEDIIYKWLAAAKHGYLGERFSEPDYYNIHFKRLKIYTHIWFSKIAADLTKGDGRSLLNNLREKGISTTQASKVRTSINTIYKWGIEEKLINSNSSPVEGLSFKKQEEKVPHILTLEEVKKLLYEAKVRNHPWYHIWSFALLTGMRSGELMALKWSDIELEKMVIRVARSFNTSIRKEKSTKSGYWRTVPISPELLQIINELKMSRLNEEFVLYRFPDWSNGFAGSILRDFLKEIGIDKEIVFHTLRACFATHLLSSGAESTKVMSIGGWKDFKTFQIYIRLAGVSVKGVTDRLLILPVINEDNIIPISAQND